MKISTNIFLQNQRFSKYFFTKNRICKFFRHFFDCLTDLLKCGLTCYRKCFLKKSRGNLGDFIEKTCEENLVDKILFEKIKCDKSRLQGNHLRGQNRQKAWILHKS